MQKPYLIVAADLVTTGGMDAANYALAEYLADRGTPVHLVAHTVAPELAGHANIIVHDAPKPLGSYVLGEPVLNRVGRSWAAQIGAQGGHVVVNGGNCNWPDANWIHYVHAAYTPEQAGSVARRAKVRFGHWVSLINERQALRAARVLISNSDRTKHDLVQHLGIPAEKIHTVYCGVDPSQFRPPAPGERAELRHSLNWPDKKPMVAFVGALGNRRKGFDTLFSAWQALCEDPAWDADLVVIGTGVELRCWIARAAASRLASRIHFMGFRTDVPRLVAACDAVVAPSRYEPYGLAVQEALCCEIPALTTRGAGIAERYPPELAGLLMPDPNDHLDLARRLRAWRTNSEHFRAPVAAFGEKLRAYSWRDMAADLVRAIESDT